MYLVAEKIIFVIDPKLTMPQILVWFGKYVNPEVYKTKCGCILISGRINGNARC